jgi:hypothetical protein
MVAVKVLSPATGTATMGGSGGAAGGAVGMMVGEVVTGAEGTPVVGMARAAEDPKEAMNSDARLLRLRLRRT